MAVNPDVDFVLRGHHLLFDYLVKLEKLTSEEVNGFLLNWDSLPNAYFDRNPDYTESFADSDILLTDGISFLAEYHATKKPLVFLERKEHEVLTEVGKFFLEGAYCCQNVGEVFQVLESFFSGNLEANFGTKESKFSSLVSGKKGSAKQICQTIYRSFDK